MAELADAHGSGPCESNFMEVQVLLSAPNKTDYFDRIVSLFFLSKTAKKLQYSSFLCHIRISEIKKCATTARNL